VAAPTERGEPTGSVAVRGAAGPEVPSHPLRASERRRAESGGGRGLRVATLGFMSFVWHLVAGFEMDRVTGGSVLSLPRGKLCAGSSLVAVVLVVAEGLASVGDPSN